MGRNQLILALLMAAAALNADTPVYIYDNGSPTQQLFGYSMPPGTLPVSPATTWTVTANQGNDGMAYDPSSGSVYILGASGGSQKLFKFTSAGVQSTVATFTLNTYLNLAIDASGNVYMQNQATPGSVVYITAGGSGPTTYISNAAISLGPMTFDSSGNLWIVNSGGSVVEIASGGTSLTTKLASGAIASNYGNLVIDSSGNLYYPFNGGGFGASSIHKLTPCMVQSLVTNFGSASTSLAGLAYDSTSNALYAELHTTNSHSYSIALPGGAYTQLDSTALNFNVYTSAGPAATATPVCAAALHCRTVPGSQQWSGSACLK